MTFTDDRPLKVSNESSIGYDSVSASDSDTPASSIDREESCNVCPTRSDLTHIIDQDEQVMTHVVFMCY